MTAPEGQKPKADTPNLWAGPLVTFILLLTPTLILVFSNTESHTLRFAGFEWTAPLWAILLATFAAGIVLSRLFGWLWGVFSRRRARLGAAGKAA